MNLIVQKCETWLGARETGKGLFHFQKAFWIIWLAYDCLDFYLRGTESVLWLMPQNSLRDLLHFLQLILIFSQVNLVFGFQLKVFSIVLFVARATQAFFFPINDFFYCSMVSFIFIPVSFQNQDSSQAEQGVPVWFRDVLVLQTAWIYFSTAALKLGPSFISGGDLYVRQNYLAKFLNWPYPEFYLKLISTLGWNQALAWSAIVLELLLSISLVLWWKKQQWRQLCRVAALLLVVAIHGFAALTTNVFFFGMSMIAQVIFLTK